MLCLLPASYTVAQHLRSATNCMMSEQYVSPSEIIIHHNCTKHNVTRSAVAHTMILNRPAAAKAPTL